MSTTFPSTEKNESSPSHAASALPAWFTERQALGRERFDALPMPSAKDEAWRFASASKLDPEILQTVEKAPAPNRTEEAMQRSVLVNERSGKAVFVNDQCVDFEPVSEELQAKGVRYLTIEQALQSEAALLEKYLFQQKTELGSEKYFELHAAFLKAGSVLFVPRGVEIEAPFVNYHWLDGEGACAFPHTLVIAEDNAKVSLVDVFFSVDGESKGFAAGVSSIIAGAGAKVFRKVVQDWNESTVSFQLDNTSAGRDAEVKSVAVNIGAERARFENQVTIEGAGAHVKLYSLTVAEKRQEFDQRTLQTHNAPNAVSDLLYKNALLDRSRTIFSGLIRVAEGAQQTDAYQTNRNLLLDPTADANALPGLEILANDVKCSHGATTGNVDEDELFYMMSRGIDRRTAMQLLVFGFFEEIIEKVESDELAEGLRTLIHQKFEKKIRSKQLV